MRARHLPLLLLAACAPRPGERLLFPDAGPRVDAGPADAGSPPDGGPSDAGPADAGAPDAGVADGGPPDAGSQRRPGVVRNLSAAVDPDAGYRLRARWDPPDDPGSEPIGRYDILDHGAVVTSVPRDRTEWLYEGVTAEPGLLLSVRAHNAWGDGPPSAELGPLCAGLFGPGWSAGGQPARAWESGLLALDLNGDGWPDAVATPNRWGDPLVWLGGPAGPVPLPPAAVASAPDALLHLQAGDLDGDGRPDLIAWSTSGTVYRRGRGDGTFEPAVLLGGAGSALVGDFDGDGRDDLFARLPDAGWAVLSWADGGPTRATPVAATLPFTEDLLSGDFDGDGRLDVWFLTRPGVLLRGLADGGFEALPTPDAGLWGTPEPWGRAADLDGDGRDDARAENLQLGSYRADGGFDVRRGPDLGGGAILAADLDGDGVTDLFNGWVWLNDGRGTFTRFLGNVGPTGAYAVSDLDHDGRPDLLYLGQLPDGGTQLRVRPGQ